MARGHGRDSLRTNLGQAAGNIIHEQVRDSFEKIGLNAATSSVWLNGVVNQIPDGVLKMFGAGVGGALEVSETTVPDPVLRNLIKVAAGAVSGFAKGADAAAKIDPKDVDPAQARSKLLDAINQKVGVILAPAKANAAPTPQAASTPPPPPFIDTLSPEELHVLMRLTDRGTAKEGKYQQYIELALEGDNLRKVKFLRGFLAKVIIETGTGEPFIEVDEEFYRLLNNFLRPGVPNLVEKLGRWLENKIGQKGQEDPDNHVVKYFMWFVGGVTFLAIIVFLVWLIALVGGLLAMIGGGIFGSMNWTAVGTVVLAVSIFVGSIIPGFVGQLAEVVKSLTKLVGFEIPKESFTGFYHLLLDLFAFVSFFGAALVLVIGTQGSDAVGWRWAVVFASLLMAAGAATYRRRNLVALEIRDATTTGGLLKRLSAMAVVLAICIPSATCQDWQQLEGTVSGEVYTEGLKSNTMSKVEVFGNHADEIQFDPDTKAFYSSRKIRASLPGAIIQTNKVDGRYQVEWKPGFKASAISMVGLKEWWQGLGVKKEPKSSAPSQTTTETVATPAPVAAPAPIPVAPPAPVAKPASKQTKATGPTNKDLCSGDNLPEYVRSKCAAKK